MKPADMTTLERRILAYLDQQGGAAHRGRMVADLASPESRAGRGIHNGSNGAAPLIAGKWCKRLIAAGWVRIRISAPYTNRRGVRLHGFYQDHAITTAGKAALRSE